MPFVLGVAWAVTTVLCHLDTSFPRGLAGRGCRDAGTHVGSRLMSAGYGSTGSGSCFAVPSVVNTCKCDAFLTRNKTLTLS
jgi:hypothetical protein